MGEGRLVLVRVLGKMGVVLLSEEHVVELWEEM